MNNCDLYALALAGLLVIPAMGSAERRQVPAALRDERVLSAINPDIQRRLKEFSVSKETDRKLKTNPDEAIREWSNVDKPELVRQIFLFLRTKNFAIDSDEQEAWRAAWLLNSLRIADEDKLRGILPLLGTSDITLQKMLCDEMKSIDERDNGERHDFLPFATLIRQQKDDPPAALIRYMYDRDPPTALLSMARVYGDKATETELIAELKGDSKVALRSLADRSEWWAHLYVAETMKKQPQLRDAAILKKLEKDDNPLVKEKVAEVMVLSGGAGRRPWTRSKVNSYGLTPVPFDALPNYSASVLGGSGGEYSYTIQDWVWMVFPTSRYCQKLLMRKH